MNFDLRALEQALREKSCVPDTGWAKTILSSSEPADFPKFRIHVFETVSSTNTVVWELQKHQSQPGTVAIALTQQAGRGQRGHQWFSERGGLYLSLGLAPDLPIEQSSTLTLSSAWGIATALHSCGIAVGIKWLNDLVFAGQKLGGILTETRSSRGRIHQAVIGVGINWSNSVPKSGVNLQTIQANLQKQPIDSLEALAAIVLLGLKRGYCYGQQQGIHKLIAAYETLLVNVGDVVAIDGNSGKIVGITPTGQLRVQLHSPTPAEICLEPGAIRLGYGSYSRGMRDE